MVVAGSSASLLVRLSCKAPTDLELVGSLEKGLKARLRECRQIRALVEVKFHPDALSQAAI